MFYRYFIKILLKYKKAAFFQKCLRYRLYRFHKIKEKIRKKFSKDTENRVKNLRRVGKRITMLYNMGVGKPIQNFIIDKDNMSLSIILENFLKKEKININYFIKKDEINIDDINIYIKEKNINYFKEKNQKFIKNKKFYEKNKLKIEKIEKKYNKLKKLCGLNIYKKKRKKELLNFLKIDRRINKIYKRKNHSINVKIVNRMPKFSLIYNYYKNLIFKKRKIFL